MNNRTEEERLNRIRETIFGRVRRILSTNEMNYSQSNPSNIFRNYCDSTRTRPEDLIRPEELIYASESRIYRAIVQITNELTNTQPNEQNTTLCTQLNTLSEEREYALLNSIHENCANYQSLALSTAAIIPWTRYRQSNVPLEVRQRNEEFSRTQLNEILQTPLNRENLGQMVNRLDHTLTYNLFEAKD